MPVVALGGQGVQAVDLRPVAHLLNIPYDAEPQLSPSALKHRLVALLRWLDDFAQSCPNDLHNLKIEGRERSLWDIVEHVVEISRIYEAVAANQREFDASAADANSTTHYTVFLVSGEINRLIDQIEQEQCNYDKELDTYFGNATLHWVLERTTWHTAQHLRQLEDMVLHSGTVTITSLDKSLLTELPLPTSVWD